MARITAPHPGFNGRGVGGVVFTDSVAHTDNPAVIDYCLTSGYTVEIDDAAGKALDKMTKPELLVYAEASGIEVDPSAKKSDILAAVLAAEAGDDADAGDSSDESDAGDTGPQGDN